MYIWVFSSILITMSRKESDPGQAYPLELQRIVLAMFQNGSLIKDVIHKFHGKVEERVIEGVIIHFTDSGVLRAVPNGHEIGWEVHMENLPPSTREAFVNRQKEMEDLGTRKRRADAMAEELSRVTRLPIIEDNEEDTE